MTGGGRGVGRAIVERLLGDGDVVVAIELDPAALAWVDGHPAGDRVAGVAGDAADEAVTGRAADLAEAAAAAGRVGQQRRRVPRRLAPRRPAGRGAGADRAEPGPGGGRVRDRGPPVPGRRHRRGDRQRLLPPGPPGRPRRPPLRHRQGGRRGPDPRPGRRLRPPRHPGQRRRPRLDRHRALPGAAGRPGAGGGRPHPGRDGPAPSPGPGRAARRGRGRGRPPAVGGGQLRQRRRRPGGRRPLGLLRPRPRGARDLPSGGVASRRLRRNA